MEIELGESNLFFRKDNWCDHDQNVEDSNSSLDGSSSHSNDYEIIQDNEETFIEISKIPV